MTCERCHQIIGNASARYCPRCGCGLGADATEHVVNAAAVTFQIAALIHSLAQAAAASEKLRATQQQTMAELQKFDPALVQVVKQWMLKSKDLDESSRELMAALHVADTFGVFGDQK